MKAVHFLLCMALAFSAHAQTFEFQSTVTDASGRFIPFAHVVNHSNGQGAYTDNRGGFKITVQLGDSLTVSHQGFQTVQLIFTEETKERKQFQLRIETAGLPEVTLIDESFSSGQRSAELPTSTYIITPAEIRRHNYTDVNRQLRTVPGINIQEEDGWGLRPNIGFRGSGVERSSNITLLEDGILVAPAPYSAPAAYYFPSFGRMQGVEVMKGASQIKYGPHTTGGAINLVSTAIPEKTAAFIGLNGGSFGLFNRHIWVGTSSKHFGLVVENFSSTTEGFKELPSGDNTGFDKDDYLVKFRINSDRSKEWVHALNFRWSTMQEVSNETYLGITEEDFSSNALQRYAGSGVDQMDADQNMLSLRYTLTNKRGFELSITAYQTEFARNWYKLDKVTVDSTQTVGISSILSDHTNNAEALDIIRGTATTEGQSLNVKANNRMYYARGVQLNGRMEWSTNGMDQNIEFGFRLHNDEMDRFQWVDQYGMDNAVMQLIESGTPGTESNRIESARAFSGFVQYQWAYEKWTVIPGVRYENIHLERRDFGSNDPNRTGTDLSTRTNAVDALIPGLRLLYFGDENWTFNAGAHYGFAPPGTTPGTLPERSMNYEIGTRYESGLTQLQFTGFYSDYSNLLGSDLNAGGGAGTNDLFNGGDAAVAGIEVLARHDLAPSERDFRMPLTLSYTYTYAVFLNEFESDYEPWGIVENGFRMPYLPEHQWSAQLGFETRVWSVYNMISYQSQMRTVAGVEDPAEGSAVPGYLVWDISAQYQINWFIQLTAGIRNVTDNRYVVSLRPAGFRPGLPRTFTIGVQARL